MGERRKAEAGGGVNSFVYLVFLVCSVSLVMI